MAKHKVPASKMLLAGFYEKQRRREATAARRAEKYAERQEDMGTRRIMRARNAKTIQLKRINEIKKRPSVNGIHQLHNWLASPDTDPVIKVTAAELLSRWALNDLRGNLRVRRQPNL